MKYPSQHVASVTRKINDIAELRKNDPQLPIGTLQSQYEELSRRYAALEAAYSEQHALANKEEKQDLQEWFSAKETYILAFMQQLANELRLNRTTGIDLDIQSHCPSARTSGSSRRSGGSRTSSTRHRLAEKQAHLRAQQAVSARETELAKQKVELDASNLKQKVELDASNRKREVELDATAQLDSIDLEERRRCLKGEKQEIECAELQKECDRLDGLPGFQGGSTNAPSISLTARNIFATSEPGQVQSTSHTGFTTSRNLGCEQQFSTSGNSGCLPAGSVIGRTEGLYTFTSQAPGSIPTASVSMSAGFPSSVVRPDRSSACPSGFVTQMPNNLSSVDAVLSSAVGTGSNNVRGGAAQYNNYSNIYNSKLPNILPFSVSEEQYFNINSNNVRDPRTSLPAPYTSHSIGVTHNRATGVTGNNLGFMPHSVPRSEFPRFVPDNTEQNAGAIRRDIVQVQNPRIKLPTKTLKVFDGSDLTEFKPFMMEFERSIEPACCSDLDRYQYLEQQTSGPAQQLVKSCNQENATRAFIMAKQVLRNKYGNEFAISQAYIDRIHSWPDIKRDDSGAMERFSLYLTACANIADVNSSLSQLNSPQEIVRMVQKLPYRTQEDFKTYSLSVTKGKGSITFKDLVMFVQHHSEVINQPVFSKLGDQKMDHKPNYNGANSRGASRGKKVFTTMVKGDTNPHLDPKPSTHMRTDMVFQRYCLLCNKNNHTLNECNVFLRKTYADKRQYIMDNKVCFACLCSRTHRSVSCTRKLKCKTCSKIHPTSLHRDVENSSPIISNLSGNRESTSDRVANETINLHASVGSLGSKGQKIIHAVVPIRIQHKDREPIYTYAALDGCSNACFINDSLIDRLGYKRHQASIVLTTMEASGRPTPVYVVNNLNISDYTGNNRVTIPVLYSKKDWPFNRDDVPKRADIAPYSNLRNVPFAFYDSGIDVLIGMNMPDLMKYDRLIDETVGGPYACRHFLGWSINGPVGASVKHPNKRCYCTKIENYDSLEQRIESYFSRGFEDVHNNEPAMSVEDGMWLRAVERSLVRLPSGHYQINLPFRQDDLCLPNNVSQALSRFGATQRRMHRDQEYFKEYHGFMKLMVDSGFAERVPSGELRTPPGRKWYLVHHGVYHKVKRKLRIVFDCSLKYNGVALNDVLLQGPDLTNSLIGVLLRFRQHGVAVVADIEKMFYQVRVPAEHANFMRFWWFPGADPKAEPVEYRLLVFVFGAVCSPSVANFALRRTAVDFADDFPGAAAVGVRRHFYVDDFLQSFSSDEEAINGSHSIRDLVAKGGFNLTGFLSNSRIVMQDFKLRDPDLLAKDTSRLDLFHDELPSDRALGVAWNVNKDYLGFNINLEKTHLTRRGLLSTAFSLYDPLGLVSPVVLIAKELFQETCRSRLDWDDPLPSPILTKWQEWLREVPLLRDYHVPRCYAPPGEALNTQLHLFSDGSEKAYGVVVYARFVMSDLSVHCCPIMAKARLNPLSLSSKATIPRVELQAARLSVEISLLLLRELQLDFHKVYFWTDSKTVLQYLNNERRRFHRYVANRVSFVLNHTTSEQWCFVPGSSNPADLASRGAMPSVLLKSDLWRFGPKFLSLPEIEWPEAERVGPISVDDVEVKPDVLGARVLSTEVRDVTNVDPVERLLHSSSSWFALQRRVAWFLRLRSFLRGGLRQAGDLTLQEIRTAELEICKLVQRRCFPSFFQDGFQATPNLKNKLRKLQPFLSQYDGLIRVGGRIRYAGGISQDTKHPILLPGDHFVSTIIVRSVHRTNGHMGREHTRASLRARFWMVPDSAVIRKVIKDCIVCRRVHTRPCTQLMADLPRDRLQSDLPPFSSTGIDFFGPFSITVQRRQHKRYGVVFSCLSSRAIHLEVAASLSADSFIQALRRFLARRGNVRSFRSDNGTNLVGGRRELQACIDGWNQTFIERSLQQRNIEWKFNPPEASHFGAAWEREIRTVRQVLYSLLHQQPLKLTDENLHTLMCEIEAILNNRPLVPVSDSPDQLRPLTPNDLLLCQTEVTFPPGLFSKDDLYATRRWRQVQYLTNLFWSRWRKSYLSLLQERSKWDSVRPDVQVGDLMLVPEQMLERNLWPLAVVIKTFPGRDGRVRELEVKLARTKSNCKNRILRRPITKLILLRNAALLY